MKFTAVWSGVLSQNITLRIAVTVLSVSCVALSAGLLRLGLRDPLIIDRECTARAVEPGKAGHTGAEIESFLRDALTRRFDTDALNAGIFLSAAEISHRTQEQAELKGKGMRQRIMINGLRLEGDDVLVDADRLLSVGTVRSAVPFPLRVQVRQTERSAANPYGLTVQRISAQTPKEEAK